jgi:hypothetical protein
MKNLGIKSIKYWRIRYSSSGDISILASLIRRGVLYKGLYLCICKLRLNCYVKNLEITITRRLCMYKSKVYVMHLQYFG